MNRKVKPPPQEIRRRGYVYTRLAQSKLEGAKATIIANPNIQFGLPCLEGTRIPASSLWGQYKAGDTIERIARAYKLEAADVQACIDYIEGSY